MTDKERGDFCMKSIKTKSFEWKNVIILLLFIAFILIVAYASFQIGRNYGSFQTNLKSARKLSIECYKQLTK